MNPQPPRRSVEPSGPPANLPTQLPNKLEATFHAALSRPPAEREAYLAEACAGEADLLREVRALLQAHEAAGDFLTPEALNPAVEAQMARLKPEAAGERIGPYKLLQQIGEGGFGTVWMAEQEQPVRRRVALKVIKLGMDTKHVVARFEQERQALAMMDHPNIAKVFDAGATPTGRPYFVMELVRGIKITDYCDQANLPTADRLQLFIAVCHAVQHAHQKGIIHRDLKPSNILVTLHDGVPVPKVIDFGVAKATQQRLTDLTVFTQFEQMIGTPLYMSPEQAEMSGLDIDTRTDIYALGVLLYELLTGCAPFDPAALMKRGLDEVRRAIREQEPPRPSTALSTLAGDAIHTVAQHRQSDGAKLIGLLRGDLDWIVMKALEKDRTRRYDTANAFAEDIERHLTSEPVVACPPSRTYRLQKFVRRNRLGIAVATVVAAALLLGIAVSGWQAVRANREAERARAAERETAVERNKALAESAQAVAERQRAELERAVAELTVYTGATEVDKITTQQLPAIGRTFYFGQRVKFWRQAVEKARPIAQKYPNDERIRSLEADLIGAYASSCFEAGALPESKKAAREWLDSNTNPKAWYYGNVVHDANSLLGRVALREGDQKMAGEYLLKAGQTPGSPQLDSFGPDFTLAGELLAAGEKQAVLDYLDLVEKFWIQKRRADPAFQAISRQHAATLQQWREDIGAGRTPKGTAWKK